MNLGITAAVIRMPKLGNFSHIPNILLMATIMCCGVALSGSCVFFGAVPGRVATLGHVALFTF